MTLGEFKAWLEGYEASFSYDVMIDAPPLPNAAQWTKIKQKLDTVTLVVAPPPNNGLRGGVLLPNQCQQINTNLYGQNS